ncbi:Enoyl-CoA delta isomerase 2, mitochondrial [Larimichthys crocea]|uniref:Uncharacterized protein n=1 Tax=Larimichthys crocea TaxID=215358 RepID=A0ACD3QPQ5_LARCR|nr:Enoyl-CoA delta isomerase 2, mitochondrial [Larimichthys crocea]
MLDFVNKVKWEAWKSLGSISQDEARQQYCDLIGSLVAAEGGSSAQVSAQPAASGTTYETLLGSNITRQFISEHREAGEGEMSERLSPGAGDFYCSGNDLTNFTKIPEGGVEQMARRGGDLLRKYVKAYIDFPKPLVAVVNGPAASEMLLFNKKLTAAQACQLGLVTEFHVDSTLQHEHRSDLFLSASFRCWIRSTNHVHVSNLQPTCSLHLDISVRHEGLLQLNKSVTTQTTQCVFLITCTTMFPCTCSQVLHRNHSQLKWTQPSTRWQHSPAHRLQSRNAVSRD